MRAKLATLNDCTVPFLSRADANLRWYYIILEYSNLGILRYVVIVLSTLFKCFSLKIHYPIHWN